MKHHAYMDYLNVLSAFAVVMLHTSLIVFTNSGNLTWCAAVVMQSAFMFAVPVFFMISGANLLGYRSRYDTKTFLVKRVKRTVLALVGYSILFYCLCVAFPTTLQSQFEHPGINDFLIRFSTNRINDIYWFFYSVISLYFATPLFSYLAEHKSTLKYVLVLSGLSTFGIPLINIFFETPDVANLWGISTFSGYVFYYLAGYYLTQYAPSGQKSSNNFVYMALISVCIALASALTIAINIPDIKLLAFLNFSANTYPSGYINYFTFVFGPIAPVLAISVFCLFRDMPVHSEPTSLDKLMRKLSPLSLGVYGVHILWIRVLSNVAIKGGVGWTLIASPLIVYALSLVSAKVLTYGIHAVQTIFKLR